MCNLSEYIEVKGRIEGRAEGKAEGKTEGAISMARNLFKHNVPEKNIIAALQEELALSNEEAKELFQKEIACLV